VRALEAMAPVAVNPHAGVPGLDEPAVAVPEVTMYV
jgi:hypothetical protein